MNIVPKYISLFVHCSNKLIEIGQVCVVSYFLRYAWRTRIHMVVLSLEKT